jgi:hypothetical protein
MIGFAVLAGVVLACLLIRWRRRKAARSVAAGGAALALAAVIPSDVAVRHRAPRTRRRWAGSRGSM